MDCHTAYKKLVSSDIFKKWRGENSEAYLSHLFGETDEQLEIGPWQIGYYDREADKIITFVAGSDIEQMPAEEVFKKEGIVQELEFEKVKVSEKEAMNAAIRLQKKKYPQHPIMKGIVILQRLDRIVWNVTFITASFAALNIKIDAVKGDIVKDGLNTFFDMTHTPQ